MSLSARSSVYLLLLLLWLQCRAGLIWSGLQVGRFALSPQRLFYHLENDALTYRGRRGLRLTRGHGTIREVPPRGTSVPLRVARSFLHCTTGH